MVGELADTKPQELAFLEEDRGWNYLADACAQNEVAKSLVARDKSEAAEEHAWVAARLGAFALNLIHGARNVVGEKFSWDSTELALFV